MDICPRQSTSDTGQNVIDYVFFQESWIDLNKKAETNEVVLGNEVYMRKKSKKNLTEWCIRFFEPL